MIGLPGWLRVCGLAVSLAAAIYGVVPARAAAIIADWPTVTISRRRRS